MSSTVIDTRIYNFETHIDVIDRQIALLLADKNIHVYDDKPKKKRTSGYILYSNTMRNDVKESLTVNGEKPKSPDIMKQLAKNWKTLCHREQEIWKIKAKEIKDAEE